MSINYFDFYKLDFSKLEDFSQKINALPESKGDAIRKHFDDAIAGTKMREVRKKEARMELLFAIEPGTAPDPLQKDLQLARKNAENIFAKFKGSNPFQFEEIVHELLGISYLKNSDFSCLTSRQKYLNLMKETHFLVTSDVIEYKPESFALKFIQGNPGIRKMAIGCGLTAETYFGSCYSDDKHGHQECFKVDIAAGSKPDLVVDMHNSAFWSVLPDNYFTEIMDHTKGDFLFEGSNSANTIKEIFRVLQPKGRLKFASLDEAKQTILQDAGFYISRENERWVIEKEHLSSR